MPMPEGAQLHRNFSPILTDMGISYLPDFAPSPDGMGGFIASKVLPTVKVPSPTGTYNKWTRGDFLRLEAKKLANAEPAPIGGFATDYGTFSVDNYGIAANWTARELAEARRGGIADAKLIAAKTRYVVGQCVLRREVDTAALMQTAGNWGLTRAGVASAPTPGTTFIAWDKVTSVPVDDYIAFSQSLWDYSGIRANTMILPRKVWMAMRSNPSLIDRIKYGGTMDRPTQVTLNQLKALFEVENIFIPDAKYNSAAEGLAPVYADIWNTNVWIGYVAPEAAAETPSAGYAFTWDGSNGTDMPGGLTGEGPQSFGSTENPEGIWIREYSTDRPAARYVEAELWTTPNVTAADAGMTLTAVIS